MFASPRECSSRPAGVGNIFLVSVTRVCRIFMAVCETGTSFINPPDSHDFMSNVKKILGILDLWISFCCISLTILCNFLTPYYNNTIQYTIIKDHAYQPCRHIDLNFLDKNLFERKCSSLHLICRKCEHEITRFRVKNRFLTAINSRRIPQ